MEQQIWDFDGYGCSSLLSVSIFLRRSSFDTDGRH